MAGQLPGARVKVATVSSRTITLSEQFERPLVVGYMGFDMPILRGGRLGGPISALAQLSKQKLIPSGSVANVYRLAALVHMYQALNDIPGAEADKIRSELDKLDHLLPKKYPFSLYEFEGPITAPSKDALIVTGAAIQTNGFRSVLDYLGYARTTADTLGSYLPKASRASEEERNTAFQLDIAYRSAQVALTDIGERLNREPVLMETIDFVFLGN